MTKRRHTRVHQTEKPHGNVQNRQQIMESQSHDRESIDDFQSASVTSSLLAFIDIEIRASQRLQEVVKMVDEFLKV